MNNVIEKIEIYNFRSITKAVIKLNNINVFSGPNDIGKTNVLRALNLFFNNKTEFEDEIDFSNDFNKTTLARARESAKGKQIIRIRVYFTKPSTYKIFQPSEKIYLEKTIDRYNTVTVTTSHDGDKKKQEQISKLFNRIQFIYIPALKSKSVIDHILRLLSGYDLLTESDITNLNEKIGTKTSDLNGLMSAAGFTFQAKLGLPTAMESFWQKLSVDTKDANLDYSIPLANHGEGIKSKFIPNLLMWIVDHTSKICVWGIDEPENSLEFKQAYELSELYYKQYSRRVQMIFTTHSLSFIYPKEKKNVSIFRATREGENTSYQTYSHDDPALTAELGYLELQQKLAADLHKSLDAIKAEYRVIKETFNAAQTRLAANQRPLVVTEGMTDWILMKAAFTKLGLEQPFEFLEYTSDFGDSKLWALLDHSKMVPRPNKLICIFDRDNPDYLGRLTDATKAFKDFTNSVYAFAIPIPSHRTNYKNIAIEHYFSDTDLSKKKNGKRLLFDNEVTKNLNFPVVGSKAPLISFVQIPANPQYELTKKVYDQDVDQVVDADGNQVGMSKKHFAVAVRDSAGEFADIDFSEFVKIHSAIIDIIRA